MRASFWRDFDSAYQTGRQMWKDNAQARLEDSLAQAADQNGVTEGAYGPGLADSLSKVKEMRDDAVANAGSAEEAAQIDASYAPAMLELQRRSELTQPDYSVGTQNFGTKDAAQQASNAATNKAMANVYRQFGDPGRAIGLENAVAGQRKTELDLAAAERADALGKRRHPGDLAMADVNGNPAVPTAALAKVRVEGAKAQGEMDRMLAQIALASPESIPGLIKHGDFQGLLFNKEIADASLDPKNGTFNLLGKDGAVLKSFTKSQLEQIVTGEKPGLQLKEIPAGGKLVGIDRTGRQVVAIDGNPKPEHKDSERLRVNDAVNQVAQTFGAKMDYINKVIDASTITDRPGYERAVAEAERRVKAGESPMAVAADIAAKYRRKAELDKIKGPGGASPAAPAGAPALWSR